MALALRLPFLLAAFALLACGAEASDPGYASSGGKTGSGGSAGSGGSGVGGFSAMGGTGATGGLGSGGLAGSAGSGGQASCPPAPACDSALPNVGPKRSWKHSVSSPVIVATGFPNHRGRDLILRPNDEQWVIGKFAYGVVDKDLKDEEVDVWLDRDCGGSWEKLGTTLTTATDGQHPTVEGVTDSGGRVYFQLPSSKRVGLGRHRFHLVVAGDLSSTDVYFDVIPSGTKYFVSDVDGTLTTQETEEYGALLTASVSSANPSSPQALTALANQGYRPYYLTARPEFLVGRTREFITVHGYPPGIVRTTTGLGALGSAAVGFKKPAIEDAQSRGAIIEYAFGNKDSDAEAFFVTNVQPAAHRIFFQFTDAAYGGRRIESYAELLGEFSALPSVCP